MCGRELPGKRGGGRRVSNSVRRALCRPRGDRDKAGGWRLPANAQDPVDDDWKEGDCVCAVCTIGNAWSSSVPWICGTFARPTARYSGLEIRRACVFVDRESSSPMTLWIPPILNCRPNYPAVSTFSPQGNHLQIQKVHTAVHSKQVHPKRIAPARCSSFGTRGWVPCLVPCCLSRLRLLKDCANIGDVNGPIYKYMRVVG